MFYGYKVDTEVVGEEIAQEVVYEAGQLREVVLRQVLNTLDQQARQALIALGWTPPAP